jgi:hypothetical protein
LRIMSKMRMIANPSGRRKLLEFVGLVAVIG